MSRIKAITSISKALKTIDGGRCKVYTHNTDIADFILEDETCFDQLQTNLEGIYHF